MMRHGRGKFVHHPKYIEYQKMIAGHPNYAAMPGALSADGKPVWQVSSSKKTSFGLFYEARRDWWTRKADSLGIPGRDGDNDRWTVAARTIHPTGYRPCLICGLEKNIGYFYLSKHGARKICRVVRGFKALAGESIADVARRLGEGLPAIECIRLAEHLFPERSIHINSHGFSSATFELTRALPSSWLSPGFMGNPPYRFDGLHDYCTACRKGNDPGRADENMRTYAVDRRAFEWWSDGNWALADALYNLAGPGECLLCVPPRRIKRVSPDHIGPLACGFKHVAFFRPTCRKCNSAKNRRMSADDVALLIAREKSSGEPAAGWHIQCLWDRLKYDADDNSKAERLSTYLRGMQDVYLRTLNALMIGGHARLLRTLLHPECALESFEFTGLDRATLTFDGVTTIPTETSFRRRQRARVVRIAFESLAGYASKPIDRRRICEPFRSQCAEIVAHVGKIAACAVAHPLDRPWKIAVQMIRLSSSKAEKAIGRLLDEETSVAVATAADTAVWAAFRDATESMCDGLRL